MAASNKVVVISAVMVETRAVVAEAVAESLALVEEEAADVAVIDSNLLLECNSSNVAKILLQTFVEITL